MSNRSKQMALNDVMPGMVLAEDLLTPRGKVILPKGATLTDSTLNSLKRYEVETLTVVLSEEMSAAEEAAERTRYQERIESLFRKSSDKAAALLRQYVSAFRAGSSS
jgi:hypothetical protein